MHTLRNRPAGPMATEVTTLELFFDLVFAFTITQLAATIEHGHGLVGVGRATLLLLLLWWMYGGYAWLTNSAPPVTTRRRLLLLLGMVGNFVCALAVPHAFGVDRWAFAIGYAVVVAVHAGMYVTEGRHLNRLLVTQLLGWNLIGAALVVLGAALGGSWLVVCWVLSLFVLGILPRLIQLARPATEDTGYAIVPGHFVERHGLMLIIVLGESVLAIGSGIGTGATHIGGAQIAFAAISLMLAATLYWSYFGSHENEYAKRALAASEGPQEGELALASFGYAFYLMLQGIVLTAAGLHTALIDPLQPVGWMHATQLAGGVAIYWLGLAWFRRSIGRSAMGTLLTGVLVAAVTPVATVSGLLGLICILVVCGLAVAWQVSREVPVD